MSKLYLVTGAFGHLGSTVVRQLLERGERVRGLVLQGDTNPCPPGLIQHPLFQRVYGDVTRPDSLAAFFAHGPEDQLVVIHTAGLVSISARHKMQVYNVNVNGTANIISWCLRSHVHKLVYVSSVHAIPEPEDPAETITETQQFDPNRVVGLYAKTKAAATKRVLDAQRMGLDVTVVHPSGIIGPGDYAGSHTIQMMIDFLEGRLTACVKGGYDFVDVRDAAAGVIAAEKGRCGGCYILSGRYVPVQQLLGELARISGRKPIRVVLPLGGPHGRAVLPHPAAAAPLHLLLPVHPALQRTFQPRPGRPGAGLPGPSPGGHPAGYPHLPPAGRPPAPV